MLTNDLIEQVKGIYQNSKDWNILYLTIKNQDISKLAKTEDCMDCLRIYDSIIDGAAFLPDWLKLIALEVDKTVWFSDLQKQEQMNDLKNCAVLLGMDRPEPMATFLRGYRAQVVERLVDLYKPSEEMEGCALVKMLMGGSIH